MLGIILLYSIISFSQSTFPKVNNDYNDLRNQLKIKDNTVTILQFEKTKYLVFQKGKVFKYILSIDGEIINKKQLKKVMKTESYAMLDTLCTIDPKELNVNRNGDVEMEVQDATNYRLKLFTKEKVIDYSSIALKIFIKEKFPHYRKRITYLKVFYFLNDIFYDEKYRAIKEKCILYIVLENAKHNIENKYYVHFSKTDPSPYLLFLPMAETPELVQESFVKKNKENVIDMAFFQRYGYAASTEVLKNKKIFIIDSKENIERGLKINHVRFIPLYY